MYNSASFVQSFDQTAEQSRQQRMKQGLRKISFVVRLERLTLKSLVAPSSATITALFFPDFVVRRWAQPPSVHSSCKSRRFETDLVGIHCHIGILERCFLSLMLLSFLQSMRGVFNVMAMYNRCNHQASHTKGCICDPTPVVCLIELEPSCRQNTTTT